MPWLSYEPDVGLFVGAGMSRYNYAFRKDPYASWWRIRGGYATTANAVRVDLLGDIRRENSPMQYFVYARASGIEVVRFFGFGNESPLIDDDLSKVEQQQYQLNLGVGLAARAARDVHGGADRPLQHNRSRRPHADLSQLQPYGSDDFGQLGAQATLDFDSRDQQARRHPGCAASCSAAASTPSCGTSSPPSARCTARLSTYLTAPIPLRPTLALRAGGKYVSGDYPFHEAAHIGGAATVRGLREHRYIGDYSAWGNAELRLSFGRARIVLPAEVGIFGLADAGRVWFEGEDSDDWHDAFGGGIWIAFLSHANTLTAAVARRERAERRLCQGGVCLLSP